MAEGAVNAAVAGVGVGCALVDEEERGVTEEEESWVGAATERAASGVGE